MDNDLYHRLVKQVSDYVADYKTKPNVLFLNDFLDPSNRSFQIRPRVNGKLVEDWIFDDILVIRFMDHSTRSQFFECKDLTRAVSYMINNKIYGDHFRLDKDLQPTRSYEWSSLPATTLTLKIINIPTRIIEIFKNYIQADPYLIYTINEKRHNF